MDDWTTAGEKDTVDTSGVQAMTLNPKDDPKYAKITGQLAIWHGELLQLKIRENPVLLGDYQNKIRLNCNLLFAYINSYTDVLVEMMREYSAKRQQLFEQAMLKPKASISSSEKYASEMTRIEATDIKVVENRISQIKNEYERYNGICISLQSQQKEFNTERIMG